MSTMKVVVIVGLFLLGSCATELADECDMVGFYDELGCTPVMDKEAPSNSTKCPTAFTCPEKDGAKCRYKGVTYEDGAMIPEEVLKDRPCSQNCRCSVLNGVASVMCAIVDCPEIFDGGFNFEECIRTYKADYCCSVGSVCGKDEIAKLKTCEVNGKSYREGQSYDLPGSRKNCYCTKDWNGTIDNPEYCSDVKCDLELYNQENLFRNCAPVFLDTRPKACPIYFQCPLIETDMKMAKALNPTDVKAECSFGNLTLSVGDEVFFPKDCTVKCSCVVPPYLSCTKATKSCD